MAPSVLLNLRAISEAGVFAFAIDLNSRTLNVEVDVDNPAGRLFPGAYAFVHLKVPASAGAVTIPSNALLFRSEDYVQGWSGMATWS